MCNGFDRGCRPRSLNRNAKRFHSRVTLAGHAPSRISPGKRTLIFFAVASALAGSAQAQDRQQTNEGWRGNHQKYTIALFGDMPYGALGKEQYPNLLAGINDAGVEFSIFGGDLKSGGAGPCTDDNLYLPALHDFNTLERPLILLPDDNDWTDCWGRYGPDSTAPGADDPIERLQHERDLFFSTPYSLGQQKLELTRQSLEGGDYAQYAENVRWQYGPVVFIGLNVQGSNDNYPYPYPGEASTP